MNRYTVVPVVLWAVVAACLLYAVKANAEPVARASANGVTITVYSEPCQFKDVVSNLPQRATWVENGKTFEGCFGPSPVGVAMFYFKDDKSIAAVPFEMFAPVTGV